MIFDISIFVILIIAAVDAVSDVVNRQAEVHLAEALEQSLMSGSSSQGVILNEKEAEQISLDQAFIRHRFQEELFNLQYKKDGNDNSISSSPGGPTTSTNANKKKKSKIRLMTRKQIAEMIQLLSSKKKNENDYYYYIKKYKLTETEPPYLVKPGKNDSAVQRLVIAVEDMFDKVLR